MYEFMGFREGILVFPNGRPVPVRIDHMNMNPDTVREMSVSVMYGCRADEMIRDFERRERAKCFVSNPFLLPNDKAEIEKVIFNDPATIVIWKDKTKTVVKCQEGDTYSPELGLAMCIAKKYLGNKGNFNEVFKKWIPEDPLKTRIPKVGTKIRIISTRTGCYGAIGKVGFVTLAGAPNGLLSTDPGYNVATTDIGVWRINPDAEIEILK